MPFASDRSPALAAGRLVAVLAVGALLMLPASASALALALEQKLVAADGMAGDQLGKSVAIDGDTAVVAFPRPTTAGVPCASSRAREIAGRSRPG